MHSSAVLIWFCLFFCEVAVGVGGNDERDQSAPTQTAPQQVGFGSDRDSAGYRYPWVAVMFQDENEQTPPKHSSSYHIIYRFFS